MNQMYRIFQIASKPGRQGVLPVSRTTIWRWVRENKFPQPIRLSSGISVWRLDDIYRWIDQRAQPNGSQPKGVK
jgi:prophage regulatory protein